MNTQDLESATDAGSGNGRDLSSAGRWLLVVVMLILLLAGALLMTMPRRQSPLLADPRFVITTKPSFGVPANAPPYSRAFVWFMKLQQRYSKPHPLNYSFGASPTNRCSIHGLLNQCTEVTGVRYVIAKDVAAGTVMFGATNTLNGAQWVEAFTRALQTGQPEWWDSQAKMFRKENLVLVTKDARTVLVVPQDMAGEFQHRAALSVEQATALARRLANEQAQAQYHCQPFHDGPPAELVQGRWVWSDLKAQGRLDVEGSVSFSADGGKPSVNIILLDNQPVIPFR